MMDDQRRQYCGPLCAARGRVNRIGAMFTCTINAIAIWPSHGESKRRPGLTSKHTQQNDESPDARQVEREVYWHDPAVCLSPRAIQSSGRHRQSTAVAVLYDTVLRSKTTANCWTVCFVHRNSVVAIFDIVHYCVNSSVGVVTVRHNTNKTNSVLLCHLFLSEIIVL